MSNIELVDFYGDKLQAVLGADGTVLVVLRPVFDALQVQHRGQLARLNTKVWATVQMIYTVGADGKNRQMATLPLEQLPMALATIETTKVARHVRPKLERFQIEATRVIGAHFLPKPPPAPEPIPLPPPTPEAWRAEYTKRLPQNATLRSVPGWAKEVRSLMKAVVTKQEVTTQRAYGWLRKHYDATSYQNIHLANIEDVHRLLHAAIAGSITITRKVKSRTAQTRTNRRQTDLFGEN